MTSIDDRPAVSPARYERGGRRPNEPIGLSDVAAFLYSHRVSIAAFGFVGALAGGLYALARTRQYESSATFVTASTPARTSGIASLAGQFGVSIPAGDRTDSPDFYTRLLKSRELITTVAAETLTVPEMGGRRVQAISLFDEGDKSPAGREKGIGRLTGAVTSSVDRPTGIVKVAVTTAWPSVSQAIAQALLDAANDFNLRTRRSQAGEERRHIEQRLQLARDSMNVGEARLESFYQSNRQWQGSAELSLRQQAIIRDVTLKRDIYSQLSVALEDARAREVHDAPVITVVERPVQPVFPQSRRVKGTALSGLILAALLAIIFDLMIDYLARWQPTGDPRKDRLFGGLAAVAARLGRRGTRAARPV